MLLLLGALRHRRRPLQSGEPSAQHSADATALAVATDCVERCTAAAAGYDRTTRTASRATVDLDHADSCSCSGGKVTITMKRTSTWAAPQPGRPTVHKTGHGEVGRDRLGHHGPGRHLAVHVRPGHGQRNDVPSAETIIPLGAAARMSRPASGCIRLARHRPGRAVLDRDHTQLQRAARRPWQHRQRQHQPVGLHHPGRCQRDDHDPDLRRLCKDASPCTRARTRQRRQQLLPDPRLRRDPGHGLEPPTRQPEEGRHAGAELPGVWQCQLHSWALRPVRRRSSVRPGPGGDFGATAVYLSS